MIGGKDRWRERGRVVREEGEEEGEEGENVAKIISV